MLPDSDDDVLAPASDEAGLAEAHGAAVDFGTEALSAEAAHEVAAEGTDESAAEAATESAYGALGPAAAPAELGNPVIPVIPVLSDPATAPSLPPPVMAPLPPPPPPLPKPKPPIRPERVVDDKGETTYRTDGILLERAQSRSWFVTITPPGRTSQRIYVPGHSFDKLLTLSEGPAWETGRLWKALCDIPLDRPLPNRRLEEELRALLTAFAGELRK